MELVIVIAIVIILSVVSVPIYRGYTNQAKMAEGYALLGTILSSQKAYFTQYGNFLHTWQGSGHVANFTCNENVFGIDARGNKYFTFFSIGMDGSGVMDNLRHYFAAVAKVPEGVYGNDIYLLYNITKGATYSSYFSNDWK